MTRQPYDRLETESVKAYEAFTIYRDLGTNRTLENVATKLSKSETLINRWSFTYAWVDRAAAWDDHIEAEARKRVERDAIKRKADMLKRHADVGRFMQTKGIEKLRADGIDKSSDAITAIKTGVTMERQSEGLPEYLLEIVNASDDELQRRYNDLLAALGGAGSGDETPGDTDTGAD